MNAAALSIGPWTGPRALPLSSVLLSFLAAFLMSTCVVCLTLEVSALGAATRGLTHPLLVAVHGRGYALWTDDARATRLPCLDGACRTPDTYDTEGLTARLARIKDRHPDERTLYLLPTASVPLSVLYQTVSACTVDRRPGQPPRLLFPDVRVLEPALVAPDENWRPIHVSQKGGETVE